MPNATITIYLNGEDYKLYWDNREDINNKARKLVKKEVANLK